MIEKKTNEQIAFEFNRIFDDEDNIEHNKENVEWSRVEDVKKLFNEEFALSGIDETPEMKLLYKSIMNELSQSSENNLTKDLDDWNK